MIALTPAIEIGYDDAGGGVPVVFLHAFPLSRAMWQPQLTALVDRCRCVAPDFRGFGETPAVPPFSMDRYADDVAALLDVLRIERAVIAGLSMGGYVAFAVWRRHRERVRALLLADTRPGPDTEEARERRRRLIELARTRGSEAVADAQLPALLGKQTREKHQDLVEAARALLVSAPVPGIVGALEAMMARPDSTPTLATIDVPTLIVVGEDDAVTPVAEARTMQAAIRGGALEIIAGAGHLSSYERPAAFNHVVSEFLARVTYD